MVRYEPDTSANRAKIRATMRPHITAKSTFNFLTRFRDDIIGQLDAKSAAKDGFVWVKLAGVGDKASKQRLAYGLAVELYNNGSTGILLEKQLVVKPVADLDVTPVTEPARLDSARQKSLHTPAGVHELGAGSLNTAQKTSNHTPVDVEELGAVSLNTASQTSPPAIAGAGGLGAASLNTAWRVPTHTSISATELRDGDMSFSDYDFAGFMMAKEHLVAEGVQTRSKRKSLESDGPDSGHLVDNVDSAFESTATKGKRSRSATGRFTRSTSRKQMTHWPGQQASTREVESIPLPHGLDVAPEPGESSDDVVRRIMARIEHALPIILDNNHIIIAVGDVQLQASITRKLVCVNGLVRLVNPFANWRHTGDRERACGDTIATYAGKPAKWPDTKSDSVSTGANLDIWAVKNNATAAIRALKSLFNERCRNLRSLRRSSCLLSHQRHALFTTLVDTINQDLYKTSPGCTCSLCRQ